MTHDQRNAKRQAFQQTAFIDAGEGAPPRLCTITDISKTGCHISAGALPLSSEFSLLLTRDGTVRRHCRVTRRDDRDIEVVFVPAPKSFNRSPMPSSPPPSVGGTAVQPVLIEIDS